MEKKLVDIIISKGYQELSQEERQTLNEWCTSEEEYDQLKLVFETVEGVKLDNIVTVQAATKLKLDALFASERQQQAIFWNRPLVLALYPREKPMVRRPLVQLAAVFLLLLLTYPLLEKWTDVKPAAQLAKNESASEVEAKSILSQNKKSEVREREEKEEAITKNTTPQAIKTAIQAPVLSDNASSLALQDEPQEDQFTVSSGSAAQDNSSFNKEVSSSHPDGIYQEPITASNAVSAAKVSKTQSVQAIGDRPQLLDLLTSTY